MPKDTTSPSFVDMNNLEMSDQVRPLFDKVVKHVKENVDPISDEFYALAEQNENRWHLNERQLELLEEQRIKPKSRGYGISFYQMLKQVRVFLILIMPTSQPN